LKESIVICELEYDDDDDEDHDIYYEDNGEQKTDFIRMMKFIIENYELNSLPLIVSQVQEAFSSSQNKKGCIVVLITFHFNRYSETAVKRYFDEGIIECLLDILKSDSTEINLKLYIFYIFSKFTKELTKLNLVNVVNCVLKQSMKIMNENPSKTRVINQTMSHIAYILEGVNPNNVNLSEKDFEKLFNIAFLNINMGDYLHCISTFLNFCYRVDKRIMDKAIINLDHSGYFLRFEKIVKSLKFDFKPWLGETIKICIREISEEFELLEDLESNDLEFFHLFITLIILFGERCEMYISKYNVVDLMITFLEMELTVIA
jgi:hypothetical protein